MTRSEHLAWAKERAIKYLESGELANAVASMGSDLNKHPELAALGLAVVMALGMTEVSRGPEAVRRWIEGFN